MSMNWSAEQEAIFKWFSSSLPGTSLLVTARAGTGKTSTITEAFNHVQGPQNCLYAVFNKKNQVEAAAKIMDPRVEVKTLHSVGNACLRASWGYCKADDKVEWDRINACTPMQTPDQAAREIYRLVGFCKNVLVDSSLPAVLKVAEDYGCECPEIEFAGWTQEKLAKCAFDVLELSKRRDPQGRISFNDMIWLPVALGIVKPLFDLVVVDEAQDMNAPQLMMARKSVKPTGRMVVVGDDRQAIYGFRGAVQDGMGMMQRELQAAQLTLSTTYRCPRKVVDLAKQLVPGYLSAQGAPEGTVEVMGDGNLCSKLKVGDAVLSRTNAPLMPLCLQTIRAGIPARVEGKDVGKFLLNLMGKIKGASVPDFITRLHRWCDKSKTRLKDTENFEVRAQALDDQRDTLLALAEDAKSVKDIENRITTMFSDTDGFQKPAVVFSSVHKAKGLEWPNVFVLEYSFRANPTGEEENIYYVALTRTQSALTLVGEKQNSKRKS